MFETLFGMKDKSPKRTAKRAGIFARQQARNKKYNEKVRAYNARHKK